MSHPPQLPEVDISCVLDALCCLCVADNRISRGEFSVVLEALKAAGVRGSEHELRARVEARCRAIHKAGIRKCAEATIAAVRTAGNPQLGDLICRLQATALSADGKVMDRESEVARLFRDAFHGDIPQRHAVAPDGYGSGPAACRPYDDTSTTCLYVSTEVTGHHDATRPVSTVFATVRPPSQERLAETRSLCLNLASGLTSMVLFVPTFAGTEDSEPVAALSFGATCGVVACVATGLWLAVRASSRLALVAAVASAATCGFYLSLIPYGLAWVFQAVLTLPFPVVALTFYLTRGSDLLIAYGGVARQDESERLRGLLESGCLSDMEYAKADAQERKTRLWAMILHLSLLSALVVPLAGLLAPIIIWQVKKPELPQIDPHGRTVVNWILNLCTALMLCAMIHLDDVAGLTVCVLTLAGMNVVVSATGGILASRGQLWAYPSWIAFLK